MGKSQEKLLFCWLTPNDPISEKNNQRIKGPIITLLENINIDVICLFYSGFLSGQEYLMFRMEEYLKKYFPNLKIVFKPIYTSAINEYLELYPLVKKSVLEIEEEFPEHMYLVQISPGTQQMHTIWIILYLEGILEASFIQTRAGFSEIKYINEELEIFKINIFESFELLNKKSNYLDINKKALKQMKESYQLEIANLKAQIFKEQKSFFMELSVRDQKYLEKDILNKMLDSDYPILLLGETGTGKTCMAKKFHSLYEKIVGKKVPFVEVDCTGLSEELAYTQLFGHVKGIFTGAERERKGAVEYADGGILFLDEVGELSLNLQGKLLKFLDVSWSSERKEYVNLFSRLGEYHLKREVKVKVILATNRNLEEEVEKGNFRGDLFQRISVFQYKLEPLRNKNKKELEKIIDLLWQEEIRGENKILTSELKNVLLGYDYHRGNFRELKNILVYLKVFSGKEKYVSISHLPVNFFDLLPTVDWKKMTFSQKLSLYQKAVSVCKNKKELAKYLGISRTTLYKFLEELNKVST